MASKNVGNSYTLDVPDLDTLPYVPLANVRGMPIDPVVYFVRGADRHVVYVGSTDCLAQRYAGHHRLRQFQALEQGELAWKVVENKAHRLALEAYCIDVLQPTLNNSPVLPQSNRWGQSFKLMVLRVPEPLYHALRLLAENSRRSLPQHIIRTLERAIEPPPDPLPQVQSPSPKASGRKRAQPDVTQLQLFG
jgi:hypothetical protein